MPFCPLLADQRDDGSQEHKKRISITGFMGETRSQFATRADRTSLAYGPTRLGVLCS